MFVVWGVKSVLVSEMMLVELVIMCGGVVLLVWEMWLESSMFIELVGKRLMSGDCMICMGICGSGVWTYLMWKCIKCVVG